MDKTDEELMHAYQNGDSLAFDALYARHSSKVYGYLHKRLRSPELSDRVDDVFQAVFMKLHHSRGQYQPGLPFLPWLFTICRTAWVDQLRAQGRAVPTVTLEEDGGGGVADLSVFAGLAGVTPTEVETPLPLNQLPPEQRRSVELRYYEERSFEEIARTLNKSPANVRQLVSRGVRRLALLMKGVEHD